MAREGLREKGTFGQRPGGGEGGAKGYLGVRVFQAGRTASAKALRSKQVRSVRGRGGDGAARAEGAKQGGEERAESPESTAHCLEALGFAATLCSCPRSSAGTLPYLLPMAPC